MPVHANLDVKVVNLLNKMETALFIQSVIKKYKRVDAAMMLVGGFATVNIAVTSDSDLQKQFALNFETAYHITRPLFEHMCKNETGRLAFIGARPAIEPSGKYMLAYALSKSLLFKLAEFLNVETVGKNIVANMVVPSTLDTTLNRKNMPETDLATWVKPEQLAEVLEFITSDHASALRKTVLKVYNNTR